MVSKSRDIHTNGKLFRVTTPNELRLDDAYQRELNERRAREIGENYKEEQLGVPIVSLRDDGYMYIVDGQHRIFGLRLAGKGDMRIVVEIRRGLTQQDEALLFYELQKKRSAVRAVDRYKARFVYGDPVIRTIDKMVRKLGLRVAKSPGPRLVAAVQALEFVHTRHGNLWDTLSVLRSWANGIGGDPTVYDGQVMRHVSTFLVEFPTADREIFGKKLLAYGNPQKLLVHIKAQAGAYSGESRTEAVLYILLAEYNRRNRRKLTRKDRAGAEDETA